MSRRCLNLRLTLLIVIALLCLVGICSGSTNTHGDDQRLERSSPRLLQTNLDTQSESIESASKPQHKTKKDSTAEGVKEKNPLVKKEQDETDSSSHPSTLVQLLLATCIFVSSIGIHYWKMKRSKSTARRKGGDYAPISTGGGETEMTPVESSMEDQVDAEYGEEADSD